MEHKGSSRDPNLQNLPSNSAWGKAIKSCFVPDDGWLFCGSDFQSLEDKIGAILSKCPVKRKENLLNYDGHALRAAAFFKEELLALGYDIDMDDPKSVNRIKEDDLSLRQRAKPVSFLKQYGGGAGKIQKVLKCSAKRAQEISQAYDELYSEVIRFNERNSALAKKNGYVECAFGLKLKTPRANARDNGVSAAEGRSSNNAITQSWGMLMNRAFIEFDLRVERDNMSDRVKLINTIHDATYMLVKNDAEAITWVNENLIECMQWQEHPLLLSDIKLGAELDIGPSWDKQYTIPNNFSEENIQLVLDAINEHQTSDEINALIKQLKGK